MTLFDFLTHLNIVAASFFTPEDAYIAQLCGALEALNAGVTAVLDHYHLANTPEHVHAGWLASSHSGLRTVFAMGTNQVATFPRAALRRKGISGAALLDTRELVFEETPWQRAVFDEYVQEVHERGEGRIADKGGSRMATQPSEPVVRVGLALDRWKKMAGGELEGFVSSARRLPATPITLHVSNGVFNGKTDEPLVQPRLKAILGPDVVLSHANMLQDGELALAAKLNVKLSATPEVEHHLNMGTSILKRAACAGCTTGLGTDTAALVEGSMFGVLRSSLAELRRSHNKDRQAGGAFPRTVDPKAQEAFVRATMVGAQVLLQADSIGALRKGARADIVLIDGASYNMLGSLWDHRDVVAAVVGQATVADVKDVFVNGRRLKRGGRLAPLSEEAQRKLEKIASGWGVDVPGEDGKEGHGHSLLRKLAEASAARIMGEVKYVDMDAVGQQVGNFLGVRFESGDSE